MNWIELNTKEQLLGLIEESKRQPVLIFKHSTRCGISSAALNRLERNWQPEKLGSLKTYYLDLLLHRTLSQQIAVTLEVEHESPQLLLVRNGKPILVRSHFAIRWDEVEQLVAD